MNTNVLITGATGMIGGIILQKCLDSTEVKQVISLVRKPTGLQHDKLKEVIIDDFEDYSSISGELENINVVYYCLGVYTGAVPRDVFRKITVDYPRALAEELVKYNSSPRFCLLSGQGADRKEKSRMMFAKDKGAIENILSNMPFEFHAFRPGYIYPVEKRKEPNFSYRLMRTLYPVLKLFGKNSSIKSTELASAMFKVGLNGAQQEILENKDILNYA